MTRRLFAAVLVAGVALVACGNGTSDAGNGGPAAAGTATGGSDTTPATTTTGARAAQARRGVRLVKIGTFSSPLYVTSPPGDSRRVMVVEQGGRIMVVRGGRRLAQPFLDISSKVLSGGEQGLLSVAFAPDYRQSGRFYVYYSEKGDGNNTVWEYRRSASNADRANPGSGREILSMPTLEANHNGGLLMFGPDGLLYIGTGDGGGGNDQHGTIGNAQDLGSLLGKLLRIDPRASGGRPYRIPSSNPFVGRAGARGEIYAYGLRNPWRYSFDRSTGDLTIGDVGQNLIEEIDFMRRGRARGANFGWRPWEGRRRNFNEPAPGAVFPVITHTHASGFCSITGGYIVRDRSVPSLFGRYVYSDLCDGRIRAARLHAGRVPQGRPLDLPTLAQVSSFGQDAQGRVYVVSLSGPVYRFAAPG